MRGMQNKKNIKNSETFVVRIYGQENATWQGEVHWTRGQKKLNFRSALELMKLIDSALETSQKDEGENTPPE